MKKSKNNHNRLFAVVSVTEAKYIPYPYVYVNDDGSVRELHQSERNYLETSFDPADGDRPYIKSSYDKKDGWGNIGGFCLRSVIPPNIDIYDAPSEDSTEDDNKVFLEKQIEFAKERGFDVTKNPDGTLALKRKPTS